MKRTQGLPVVALSVILAGVTAQGAFWNKKSSKDAGKGSEVHSEYGARSPDGVISNGGTVRSLASYQEHVPSQQALDPSSKASVDGGASNSGRRAHFLIQDQKSADALVALAESRRLREEEIRVLGRLHQEKEGELNRMNERLNSRFKISADANYQYDNETKSLFLLIAKEGAEAEAAVPEDRFHKRLHMTLSDRESEIAFVRLVSAKKITASEMQVLKLLLKEKNLELSKVHETLQERFAIAPDKHYEYDAASRTLFEIVQAEGITGNVTEATLGK